MYPARDNWVPFNTAIAVQYCVVGLIVTIEFTTFPAKKVTTINNNHKPFYFIILCKHLLILRLP